MIDYGVVKLFPYKMSLENLQIELCLNKLRIYETFNLQIVDMTVSYNHRTEFKDGESWKGHCKIRKGALWEDLHESNFGGVGGVMGN
jgi:hypothetical protein